MTDASLARSSALMALGTVASRLLGFVRTSTLTAVIGIGLAADTFDVANTLPNQFYLLLAGGVLNAVLVPQITKAATHDDGGHEFVNRLLTISFAIIAVATVVITALAPFLVRLFSAGWDEEALELATAFAFICLPQVLLYGLYTLLGQVLNANGRFAAYMWAPAVANLVAIVGLVVFRLAFGKRPAEELYDLDKDPGQLTNVADRPEYAEAKRALRADLDRWMAETGDPRATGDGDPWDRYPYFGDRPRPNRPGRE